MDMAGEILLYWEFTCNTFVKSQRVGSKREMTMPETKSVVEIHGCIVCARVFNILAVYTPDGKLVDCAVTSPGGRCVLDEGQSLVACETHTPQNRNLLQHFREVLNIRR
jgi:hypothetical protein